MKLKEEQKEMKKIEGEGGGVREGGERRSATSIFYHRLIQSFSHLLHSFPLKRFYRPARGGG